MPKLLTDAQVAAYRRDGFLLPMTAFDAETARRYRDHLEAFENRIGTPLSGSLNQSKRKYRARTYLLCRWTYELVSHPRILDVIEDVIGPDILVFTTSWFIKEAGAPHVAGWHQDATHFGLEPNDQHVTAWLALSDASLDSGCMQFIPGSHRRQLPHTYGMAASVNDAEQFIEKPGDVASAADCCLAPGQFSLHNTLCVHQSGPNRSRDRRIGIGISYVPASVRHTGSRRHPATLVRGTNRYGHWDLDPAPAADFDPRAEEVHARSFEAYRALYLEQVERHRALTA
jgi:ectoine hydroxylase-related dioxygenase (phytanoyl-CoA dioxygenase family)